MIIKDIFLNTECWNLTKHFKKVADDTVYTENRIFVPPETPCEEKGFFCVMINA